MEPISILKNGMEKKKQIIVFIIQSASLDGFNTFPYSELTSRLLPNIVPSFKPFFYLNSFKTNNTQNRLYGYQRRRQGTTHQYYFIPMSRSKSHEKPSEQSPTYTINILSAPLPLSRCSPQNEELQSSVLGWFQCKGIRKSNPEEDLLGTHRTLLKINTRGKVRKLSAPDQRSILLHRRAKECICVAV